LGKVGRVDAEQTKGEEETRTITTLLMIEKL